jgi:hypothetical protein
MFNPVPKNGGLEEKMVFVWARETYVGVEV